MTNYINQYKSILIFKKTKFYFFLITAKPPEIVEHPIDTLVRKNEPATLNCVASGHPQPV